MYRGASSRRSIFLNSDSFFPERSVLGLSLLINPSKSKNYVENKLSLGEESSNFSGRNSFGVVHLYHGKVEDGASQIREESVVLSFYFSNKYFVIFQIQVFCKFFNTYLFDVYFSVTLSAFNWQNGFHPGRT